MSYRNKTYVAFASEDLHFYNLMKAWRENEKIDFNFYDAHDLNTALDSSSPETIRRRLRERFANSKQVIVLGSSNARKKGNDTSTFFGYEIEFLIKEKFPIVIANLDRSRITVSKNIPEPVLNSNLNALSVSFQPKIIQYALDTWVPQNLESLGSGLCQFKAGIYERLGI